MYLDKLMTAPEKPLIVNCTVGAREALSLSNGSPLRKTTTYVVHDKYEKNLFGVNCLMELPEKFRKIFTDLYEHEGQIWLEHLPRTIRHLEQLWNICVDKHFSNLSYNFVAPAFRHDGTPVVLKLGFPHKRTPEANALKAYAGDGSVRLLEHESKVEALLLERLEPGESLPHFTNNEANTRITATLLQRLWRDVPNPEDFRSLDSWTRELHQAHDKYKGNQSFRYFPLLDKAVHLYQELRTGEHVLLHADLHHDNILTAQREPYLAIDPKGIVGEKGFDVGTFLVNPIELLLTLPDVKKIHRERVAIFSEMLSMTEQEVEAWGFVFAVLSGCWTVGDHGEGWDEAMRTTTVLYTSV
jgi:streptomycin 6-kinase